jgi:hypothetical protein
VTILNLIAARQVLARWLADQPHVPKAAQPLVRSFRHGCTDGVDELGFVLDDHPRPPLILQQYLSPSHVFHP